MADQAFAAFYKLTIFSTEVLCILFREIITDTNDD